tara:strand:+ start:50 stop:484 length:435 start_codon:yes stop_codon:yes gene_type:complete
MAFQKKSTSKAKSSKTSKAAAEKPAEENVTAATGDHSHKALESKLTAVEAKVSELETKLKGILTSLEALAQVKNDLDTLASQYESGKAKLGAEVQELKENAKSWVTKQKEAMDTNNDGKVNFEEIYEYVWNRTRSRTPHPKKKK